MNKKGLSKFSDKQKKQILKQISDFQQFSQTFKTPMFKTKASKPKKKKEKKKTCPP